MGAEGLGSPAGARRLHDLGVPGVRVGHWTDEVARTGCTVVLFPDGTVASGEVRGGAPATREFALLAPERLVDRIDALVLSGGSAFGLASGDGVMAHLAEAGVGYPTGAGAVPIVVGLSLFDLLVGDGSVRPGAPEGRRAAQVAAPGPVPVGAVGAGTGATVGTWRGPERAGPGGLGAATMRDGDLVVAALVAVNAFGDIDDGRAVAPRLEGWSARTDADDGGTAAPFGNTTIGLIVTNASLDKHECHLVAQSGHDGFARSLVPAHTRLDGDAIVAAATGSHGGEVPVDHVRLLGVAAMEQAVRTCVA